VIGFATRHPVFSTYLVLLAVTEGAAALALAGPFTPTWQDWLAAMLIIAFVLGWLMYGAVLLIGGALWLARCVKWITAAITKSKP
jgi:hypothetical protein